MRYATGTGITKGQNVIMPRSCQLPIRAAAAGAARGLFGSARLAVAVLLSATISCDRPAAGASGPTVAVSNTYLEAALHDVVGPAVPVVRLAPPGACPGHFDLRPSQITALRASRLVLRFDFQADLDQKLGATATRGPRIAAITVPGGLCEPASYLAACRQVAEATVDAGLLERTTADARLTAILQRLDELSAWARGRVSEAKLDGTAVVTSRHQAAFCRFLGLTVVATFTGADTASIEEINAAIRGGAPARAVVANTPEGRRLADALGQRLGVPVIVFDNFPAEAFGGTGFDALVRGNVERLVTGATR